MVLMTTIRDWIKNNRLLLALMVLAVLVVMIPVNNWPSSQTENDRQTDAKQMAFHEVGLKLFALQSQFMLGTVIAQNLYPQASGMFFSTLLSGETSAGFNDLSDAANPLMVLAKFILAEHVQGNEEAKYYWARYQFLTGKAGDPHDKLKPIIEKIYFEPRRAALSSQEADLLRAHLGWFGELAVWLADPVGAKPPLQQAAFYQQALQSFKTGQQIMAVIAAGLLISLGCFLVIIYQMIKSRNRRISAVIDLPGIIYLETFVLYLLLGVTLSGLVKLVAQAFAMTWPVAGALMITSLIKILELSVLVWPFLLAVNWQTWLSAIGLPWLPGKQVMKELATGVMAYFAFIPVGYLLLLLTMVPANLLGWDPVQGTHPIIPMLRDMDNKQQLVLIFTLAVIMAPIMEEMMFRGVFYGFLKKQLGVAWAILLSGLIFAVLHPQGVMGIIPVMGIGCYLAVLREWRQSLYAAMVVHAMINGSVLWLAITLFRL